MGFAHHEDSADLSSIDVKKLPTPAQWNLFCPTTGADVFVISIPTWLLKEELSLYDQIITGRLNLFQIICRLNRMQ